MRVWGLGQSVLVVWDRIERVEHTRRDKARHFEDFIAAIIEYKLGLRLLASFL